MPEVGLNSTSGSCATDSAAAFRIGLVCRGSDVDSLRAFRRWWASSDWAICHQPPPVSFSSLHEAGAWYCELPAARPLVAFGYLASEIRDAVQSVCQNAVPMHNDWNAAPIIVRPEDHDLLDKGFEPTPLIVSTSPSDCVREFMVCRQFSERADIRKLASVEEFVRYFQLRYEVWSRSGYLPDSRNATTSRLELDYSDRVATPFGLFLKDGTLAGCVRILRNFGAEENLYVQMIDEILDMAKDPVLKSQFQQPTTPSHPFDILEYFPGFRSCYSEYVRNNIPVGEVSRVIVDPVWRGHKLSEFLVYKAIADAREKQFRKLFLACRKELIPLYAQCGFCVLPKFKADQFGDIPVESYIMERTLP